MEQPASSGWPLLTKAEQEPPAVGREGRRPGQDPHVDPLEQRPFPTVGFPANNGHGADALQSKNIKHHQGNAEQRRVEG